MRKPIISRWYVKLTLLILCLFTAYLMVKSFKQGFEEGREKARRERMQKTKGDQKINAVQDFRSG